MGKIPLSMSERDIVDSCCWSGGRVQGSRPGIRGRIGVISSSRRSRTSEGLMIRPPRPKSVGEDGESLFAEMASLETSSGVLRPGLGRVAPPARVVCANHGTGSEGERNRINPGFLTGDWFGDRWLRREAAGSGDGISRHASCHGRRCRRRAV